ISPRALRTVTGVFTSATCTLTLACASLGACCTAVPGFGGSGPEGAWAAGAPARATSSIRVRMALAMWLIRITWCYGIQPGPVQHNTRGLKRRATVCATAYLIRRMFNGRRCREGPRFLQSRFVSTGEKTHVRRQETEAAARAESAA